jgi:ABC-type phosphate transport system substrate-binding protein
MAFSNGDVQTFLTVLTLVATTGGWLFDRYYVRRRRLSYRVHWNGPVDVTPLAVHDLNVSIMRNDSVVVDPSFVLLRVENVGSFDIAADDVIDPMTFSFGGRRIVHFEVQETDPPELVNDIIRPGRPDTAELVEYHPGGADATTEGALRLPRFAMVRKARFKVLVLLSGVGSEVSAHGRLSGGEIVTEGRRGPRSRWGLVLGGASLLMGGLLVGLIFTREAPGSQIECPTAGQLSIAGSTALDPAISEIATEYMALCPGAQIQVRGGGTDPALTQLVQAGTADAENHTTGAQKVKLAMADEYPGKPSKNPQLGYWPIGVGVFAVVVNKDTNVAKLTTAQLRALFAGDLPKWNDADLPGGDRQVVLVSRAAGSGTRDTFEDRLLERPESAPVTSSDCVGKDIPGVPAGVMHCEAVSTPDMLKKVSETPGAIGYASAAEAEDYEDAGVDIIPIDGYFPTKDDVADGSYRFWAVEKLVRFGPERQPTVRDHFVSYVTTQKSALEVLRRRGFYSCNDPVFLDGEVSTACAEGAGQMTAGLTPTPSVGVTPTPGGPAQPG